MNDELFSVIRHLGLYATDMYIYLVKPIMYVTAGIFLTVREKGLRAGISRISICLSSFGESTPSSENDSFSC